jgi:hypothetical protein
MRTGVSTAERNGNAGVGVVRRGGTNRIFSASIYFAWVLSGVEVQIAYFLL